MSSSRVVRVVLGLVLTGTVFGAVAGVATVVALMLAYVLRHGDLGLFLAWPGYVLGALAGGACGAVSAPLASLTLWRHVPLGRLFAALTLGTAVGGAVAALLVPQSLGIILFGGVLGFLFAGDRLDVRAPAGLRPGAASTPTRSSSV